MIGAEFKTHAAQVEVDSRSTRTRNARPALTCGKDWKVFDEIYQMQELRPDQGSWPADLDKQPNDKDRSPGDYPIAWCKEYGKGRVFYTSLGHREDVWDPTWPDRKNPKEVAEAYQKHILGGIKWAVGLEKMNAKPQKTAVE